MRNFLLFISSILVVGAVMFGGSYLLGVLKQAIFGAGTTLSGATKSPMEEGMTIFAALAFAGTFAFIILA